MAEELYPSAKPLPTTKRVELKERSLKGLIRVDTYNRQSFSKLFKKDRPR